MIGQVTDAAPPIEIVTSPCRYGEPPYIVGQSLPLLSRLLPVDAATGHHDAIALARAFRRQVSLQYVAQNFFFIALVRNAVAASTRGPNTTVSPCLRGNAETLPGMLDGAICVPLRMT